MSEHRLSIGVEPAKAMGRLQQALNEYFSLALRANGLPAATLVAIDDDRGELVVQVPDAPPPEPPDA